MQGYRGMTIDLFLSHNFGISDKSTFDEFIRHSMNRFTINLCDIGFYFIIIKLLRNTD